MSPTAPLGVQPNIVRRAKPRRELQCIYHHHLDSARGAGKLRRSGITIAPSGRDGQRLVYNECQNLCHPRWGHWDIVPRAKPRGTYTHKTLVSAPLDEQLASRLYPERSRGVGLLGCRPAGAANHFCDDFSAAHNSRQTCTWMSTRANDIEIGNIF